MAEKTINNPSLLPSDLAFELSGNTITAISGHPIAGSDGGTQSDYVYYPDFDETTGNIEFKLGTIDNPPSPIGGWHISGADGARGPQGEPGNNGKTPTFQINPENAHWEWKYTDAADWTDTQVVASGAVGPKGQDGTNGVTPGVRIDTNTNKWEIAADGKTWVSTDVNATGPQGTKGEKGEKGDPGQQGPSGAPGKDGAPGVDGKDGITPHIGVNNHWYIGDSDTGVSATGPQGIQGEKGEKGDQGEIGPEGPKGDIGPQGPKGDTGEPGTNGIDGKDGKDGTNGKDGVSPTVSAREVTGGTEVIFTYGTSQTETITVFDGTPGAAGTSGYSPTVSTEAVTAEGHPQGGTKVTITDLEHQSGQEFYVWNGTNGQGATVNLVDGDGIHITNDGTNYTIGVSANYSAMAVSWVQDQHYLTDIPNGYALKTDVEAASANAYNEAVAEIPNVDNFITKDVNDLTYYYKKTETSSTSEITNALSTKLDSTVAEQTYQTKSDMTNYLTTNDASTTYQPKGNYASASDITDMATKTWVGEQGFLKNTDLTDYAMKTDVDTASAESVSQTKSWVNEQNFATSADLAANTQYEMTNTGWISAIKIQVDSAPPTENDGILHIILAS